MKGKHTMEEYEVISIPVSDGTERDFAIMDTFEFEGQGYLAVSLIEGDEIHATNSLRSDSVSHLPLPQCRRWRCCGRADHFACRIQKGDKILRTDVSKKISRKEPASCDKIKKKIKFWSIKTGGKNDGKINRLFY